MNYTTARTRLKALAALLALITLILGIPAALVVGIGWPLPTTVPSPSNVWDAVQLGNISAQVIINTLACIVWLAWAQVALSAIAEAVAVHRRRATRPVRGVAAPIQLTIGRLVATAALLFSLAPRPAIATPVKPLTVAAAPAASWSEPPRPAPATTPASATPQPVERSRSQGRAWTVRRGDNLWDIALLALGSGERFKEIFELNVGKPQPDGRRLIDPGVLEPGWVLNLPTATKPPPSPNDEPTPTSTPTPSPTPTPKPKHAVPPTTPAAPPTTNAPSPPQNTYVVQRGDSLWSIAEQQLGEGHRYRELFDLNRNSAQPDGRAMIDPGVLEPGWILRLPQAPASHGQPSVPPAVPRAEAAPPVASAGSPPPPAASPATGDANVETNPEASTSTAVAPTIAAPTTQVTTEVTTTEVTDDIAPENANTSTATSPAPPPSGSSETATMSPPSFTSARTPSNAPPTLTTIAGPPAGTPDSSTSMPLLGLAGGAIAAGAWAAIRRGRLRQSIRRKPGQRSPRPAPDLEHVLAEVRSQALLSPVEEVAAALRSLAQNIDARRGSPVPQPVAVRVGRDDLTIQLAATAHSTPNGWTTTADGRGWTTNRRRTASDSDTPVPLPTLVTIGGTTETPVLLDLEAAGVISLTGDEAEAAALARSIILELADSALAPVIEVVVNGIDRSGLGDRPTIVAVDDLDEAARHLSTAGQLYRSALTEARLSNAFAARTSPDADGLPPTVLVTSSAGPEVEALAADLPSGCGVAMVVVGELEAPALDVQLAGREVRVAELGIHCPSQLLASDTAEQLAAAVAQANAGPEPVEDDEIIAALQALDPETAFDDLYADSVVDLRDASPTASTIYVEPDRRVSVGLLGPTEITGLEGKLTGQQQALLAYLVTHRFTDTGALRDAIWRDNQPKPSHVHNQVWKVRSAVGPDGLPPTTDSSLVLTDTVTSDLDRFDARVHAAADETSEAAIEILCGALDLVRGQPLAYPTRNAQYYAWVDLEHLASEWERKIGDVAHRVNEWLRDKGDASTGAWAAQQGLLGCPLNETLVADLISSHQLAGNTQAALTVYEEHDRQLEALGIGPPAPELAALVEEVVRDEHPGGASSRGWLHTASSR